MIINILTGANKLEVVSDVTELLLVPVQLERRASYIVVLLDLIVKCRVREVRVGRIQQYACTASITG